MVMIKLNYIFIVTATNAYKPANIEVKWLYQGPKCPARYGDLEARSGWLCPNPVQGDHDHPPRSAKQVLTLITMITHLELQSRWSQGKVWYSGPELVLRFRSGPEGRVSRTFLKYHLHEAGFNHPWFLNPAGLSLSSHLRVLTRWAVENLDSWVGRTRSAFGWKIP